MALINIKNLTFSYDSSCDFIFKDTSLQINTDWKLGLVGRNGKGKSTLLNLLLGKFEFSGKIDSNVSFEYFPFEVQRENSYIYEILEEILPNIDLWQFEKELRLLQIDAEIVYRQFCSLSKGEQTKVLLAILFLKEDRFLLRI